jgi:hypothetical protein
MRAPGRLGRFYAGPAPGRDAQLDGDRQKMLCGLDKLFGVFLKRISATEAANRHGQSHFQRVESSQPCLFLLTRIEQKMTGW